MISRTSRTPRSNAWEAMSHAPSESPTSRFRSARAAIACTLSFGFAFALVPLYEIACEKVFGIRADFATKYPNTTVAMTKALIRAAAAKASVSGASVDVRISTARRAFSRVRQSRSASW